MIQTMVSCSLIKGKNAIYLLNERQWGWVGGGDGGRPPIVRGCMLWWCTIKVVVRKAVGGEHRSGLVRVEQGHLTGDREEVDQAGDAWQYERRERDDGQLWRCSLASHAGARDGDHKVGVAMLCKMTWYYLVDVVKGEGSGHLDLLS